LFQAQKRTFVHYKFDAIIARNDHIAGLKKSAYKRATDERILAKSTIGMSKAG
jgi:hypothetical protein